MIFWRRAFIDAARPDEAGTLAEIHREAFRRTWSAHDFSGLMAEPTVFTLVARQTSLFGGQRVAGFVLVRFAADEAEILTIAVRPKIRRQGIGRMLMNDVTRRLYRERIASLFLEVDRQNAAAVALYRSMGFAVAGERRNYYPLPGADTSAGAGTALVMRLQVG